MARNATKSHDKPMIPVARPHLGQEEVNAASEAILSGWVTQGPRVKAFEDAFARTVGAPHACAVSNCTAGLQLALMTVGVKPGDIVITVSYSFIATANSVRACGAEPVFVDIDSKTYTMDPAALGKFLSEACETKGDGLYYKDAKKLTVGESPLVYIDPARIGRIAAIMPVHQLGMPCDMEAILKIAREYHIPVVEDAACALGSEVQYEGKWETIGKPHGDVACFSFHPRKIITTGDGGMLTTNNAGYDRQFRLLRNHGMSVSGSDRVKSKKVIFEKYLTTGFNYRMTDIQAAIGLAQLDRLPAFIAKRKKINEYYHAYLADIPWIELPFEPAYARTNWQSYSVKILAQAPRSWDDIIQYLFNEGVYCIPGVRNVDWEAPYKNVSYDLPACHGAQTSTIIFPLYVDITEETIKHIGSLLRDLS